MVKVTQENRTTLQSLSAGSSAEAAFGGGALVLAILGMIGFAPHYMLMLGIIGLGIGLMIRGGVMIAQYSELMAKAGRGQGEKKGFGGGAGVEAVSGGIGLILGMAALLFIAPHVLSCAAVIVLGLGAAVSSVTALRLNNARLFQSDVDDAVRRSARVSVRVASGVQILAGLFAALLGAWALNSAESFMLRLIGVLILGAVALLAGTALTGRAASLLARSR